MVFERAPDRYLGILWSPGPNSLAPQIPLRTPGSASDFQRQYQEQEMETASRVTTVPNERKNQNSPTWPGRGCLSVCVACWSRLAGADQCSAEIPSDSIAQRDRQNSRNFRKFWSSLRKVVD